MALRFLNYENAKKAVMLTMLGSKYRVPMLIGERGVGKTAMMEDIAKEMNANLITIDANVLKEGEVGGLPHIYSSKNFALSTQAIISGLSRLVNSYEKKEYDSFNECLIAGLKKYAIEEKKIQEGIDKEDENIVLYAPNVKLQETKNLYKENPDKKTILFIDEFNRCDSIVKREIMNLVLNREINGFKLPENVYVICACNPTSNFEIYSDTDYQVEEMDEAQLDRFRWISVKSDIDSWVKWGMSTNPDTGDSYIDDQVIEYLVDHEEFLNNIASSKEDIKTSPRSWEFVSDSYRTFVRSKENKKYASLFSSNDLLNAIIGDVGLNIASDFISFLEDNKHPLIKPAEIFEGDCFKKGRVTDSVKDIIEKESILRKNVLIRNCLRYIKNEYNQFESITDRVFNNKEKIFIEILTDTIKNGDILYSVLLDMKMSVDDSDKKYLKHLLDKKDINILNAWTKLNQSF